jgi:hypothetical protein
LPTSLNTFTAVETAINNQWDRIAGKGGPGGAKMDWLEFELVLVAILQLPLDQASDAVKIQLTKEAVDAYTGRGYFR